MSNYLSKTFTEIKVGIFTLVGLLILAFIIISVGDFHLYQRGYKINILFNNVEGLDITSPVRLSGMEVGEVKEMQVEGEKIKVVAWIRADAPIRVDSQVTINSLGIIGEKYIEITRGSPHAKILKDGDTIIGIDPVSVGDLLYKTEKVILNLERTTRRIENLLQGSIKKGDINQIVKNTLNILENINGIIKENRENVKKSFQNLNKSSKTLLKVAKATSETISNIEKNINFLVKDNRENIKTASLKFKESALLLKKKSTKISEDIENLIKNLNKTINKNKDSFTTILKNYRKSSEEFIKISKTLNNIVSKIEKGEGLLGKISSDKVMAENLENIIQNLNEFSEEIKKHPWKLIRK